MRRGWILAAMVLLGAGVESAAFAQAKAAEKPAEKKVTEWKNAEKVEVKWGGLWQAASIVNRRGEWYLIEYSDRAKRREWVEYWRIRKPGDTEDSIGYARPNGVYRPGDNPPREKAGEPAEPIGAAAARKDPEKEKAKEEFKNDAAYKGADWSDAKKLEVGGGGGEKLVPDAAVKVPNARPIRMAGASKEFFEEQRNLLISRGAGNFALVVHGDLRRREGQSKLEKLDLAGGKSAGVFELPDKMVPLDVSPDGKLVAMRNDEFGFGVSTRLEVVALD